MDTIAYCQHCGKPLSAKAVQGLCPECFMKVGLGSAPGTEAGKQDLTREARRSAPSVAEIGKLFPQLEVSELLGEGGMGAVYKAHQPQLDRVVALKILMVQAGQDPGFAERFTREARALAKLNHPNIVAVYEFGNVAGLHYFIMEYVDGLNLRQLEQTGKLSAREALRIIPQICEALQFAHDEGVVHRDIKPENVLLDKKGKAKIADFGLAKILGREPEALRLTGARDFMGTPHYMAPEQVEHPQTVDHRADIYSLGVVFYEMLTGELPLGKFQPPSRKVEVDVRLDEIVLHALEKEPDRRYQHASEVKTDVETIATSPSAATPSPAAAPAETSGWQPAILLVAGLVSTALLLTATALPPPASWIALLFGSFGVFVAGVKLAGLWPFPSAIFRNSKFTSRNLPSVRTLEAQGGGPTSPSPIRAAVAVGSAMFVVIFLAAVGVTVFLAKADVERNLGIGLMLGIVNGLMAGGLVYAGLWAAKARGANRSVPNGSQPHPGGGSGIKAIALFALSIILLVGFANYLWFSASHAGTKESAAQGVGMPGSAITNQVKIAGDLSAKQKTTTDQVVVEDLALEMLVAIREKDDVKLQSFGTDSVKAGWVDALPHFALELRERFTQLTGKPFTMYPAESLVEEGRAVVKCTGPKELRGVYLVLFFVKSNEGWRNWGLGNSPAGTPLVDHLKRLKPEPKDQP
jgi:predicted Ser/Thr protein kinase